MKRARKGTHGYIRYEKLKRGAVTVIMFAIPLILYFTAVNHFGSNRNIFTIVAVLGLIPAAKFAVDWIMILMQKSAPEKIVSLTEEKAAGLTRGYELVVTAYEGRMPLDAVVVCGNDAACFSSNGEKDKFAFMEKHISGILNANGYYSVNVKIFNEERMYAERIGQFASKPEMFRENAPGGDDEDPKEREEMILYIIKRISL